MKPHSVWIASIAGFTIGIIVTWIVLRAQAGMTTLNRPAAGSAVTENFELAALLEEVVAADGQLRGQYWTGAEALGSYSGNGSGICLCQGNPDASTLFDRARAAVDSVVTTHGGTVTASVETPTPYSDDVCSFSRTYTTPSSVAGYEFRGTLSVSCVADSPNVNGFRMLTIFVELAEDAVAVTQ